MDGGNLTTLAPVDGTIGTYSTSPVSETPFLFLRKFVCKYTLVYPAFIPVLFYFPINILTIILIFWQT